MPATAGLVGHSEGSSGIIQQTSCKDRPKPEDAWELWGTNGLGKPKHRNFQGSTWFGDVKVHSLPAHHAPRPWIWGLGPMVPSFPQGLEKASEH